MDSHASGGIPVSTLTLGISVLLGLATSGFLAYAGRVTFQRTPAGAEAAPVRAFAIWWYCASLIILNVTMHILLVLLGLRDINIHLAMTYFNLVPIALGVGSLLYYILFLLTGRRGLGIPIGLLYAAYFVYLVWFTMSAGQRQIVEEEWQVQLQGATPATAEQTLLFGLLLAAPVLITVIAFTVFAFRATDPVVRYRLRMMSTGFLLLFGTIFVVYVTGWQSQAWFPLAYKVPALILAILVVVAYRPPARVKARLGLPVTTSGSAAPPASGPGAEASNAGEKPREPPT